MPELPEVETIVRALRTGGRNGPPVAGLTVSAGVLLWERTLADGGSGDFSGRLEGQRVNAIDRRGKFVVITLDRASLLIHLRMSGDLRVEAGLDSRSNPLPLETHDRAAIYFRGGLRLVFNDPRKFGRMWITTNLQKVLGSLGPEPLSTDFTPDVFYHRLQAHRRRIKPLLIDQTFLVGLGNIYADESLHRGGVHPCRTACRLDVGLAERLWSAIRSTLQEGIEQNGASIDWVYRGGEFQNHFRVYQQTGKPCPVCGTPVERIVVGQRGTHFCPVCQPVED